MARKSYPKHKSETAKARETRLEKAAELVTALVVPPAAATTSFYQIKMIITLEGDGSVPQCDIWAYRDEKDQTGTGSSGFGNENRPLLVEVLKKIEAAYPTNARFFQLATDGKGNLVPSALS